MSKFHFNRVAILGLGLIGGSLALDLRRKKLAKQVVGYNRSPQARRLALKRKACDQVFADPAQAVSGADLVVLATPVRHIPLLAKKIRASLKQGALVTDVGSTKTQLVRGVRSALAKSATFVGGHPIAGTEHSGMAAALPDLFKNRWWIFTPQNSHEGAAARRLSRLAKALGAKPLTMSPQAHDETLALLSHLPHLLAYSLMQTALDPGRTSRLALAGTSFRDVTRIAASSAEMWSDISLDNRQSLLRSVTAFERQLSRLKKYIVQGDVKGLHRFFAGAAQVRRKM